MNNTNIPAQDTEQQPTFNPDFSHRQHYSNWLNLEYDATCTDQLRETVDAMVLRTKGMLAIIADLNMVPNLHNVNPENIHWALQSAMLGLDDIYAVVEAHDAAVSHKEKAGVA